jgi:septal ring factor EnvC (AmiA/AmiB activator)
VHKEQAGEVEEQIERGRLQIEEMRQKERRILDQLDRLESQLQEYHEKLETLKNERASLRRGITDKRKRVELIKGELKELRAFLGHRLQALYKFGRQAYLNLLVSAQDLREFQHNWVYLRSITEQDSRLIQQFQRKQVEEERLADDLVSKEQQLGKVVDQIGRQKAGIEKLKRQQVALLQDIHNREEMYRLYVEELEGVSQELKQKIDQLQFQEVGDDSKIRQLKGDFASKKGTFPYPVSGKLFSRFGQKQPTRFGTKLLNNGITIATDPLASVVAVYVGQVIFSSRVKGYGNVLIIDHGDKYYTLTGHLSETLKEVGEMVEAGEVIGYAGYSPAGDKGGRVYFEIRHHGKALDPQHWILPALASTDASGN